MRRSVKWPQNAVSFPPPPPWELLGEEIHSTLLYWRAMRTEVQTKELEGCAHLEAGNVILRL